MKKFIKIAKYSIALLAALSYFASCESTNQAQDNQKPKTQVEKKAAQEAEQESKSESTTQLKKLLSNIQIKLVSSNDTPFAGNKFTKPYVISVTDKNGNPYSDFELSVSYPVSKEENIVSFGETEIKTDANGNASFKIDSVFQTSLNSAVTFIPKTTNSPSLLKLAKEASLEVPCRVKFLGQKKGIMINLIDYDINDKMVLSSSLSTSSNLVGEFWRSGFTTAQNADFHKVIDNGPDAVYKAAKNLVQGSPYFKYLIYGKVKYQGDITEVQDGYSLTLKADVTVIDMTTGKAYYTTSKTVTMVEANKWNVLKACQTELAKELNNELIYSM